jgi:hypothetical protein
MSSVVRALVLLTAPVAFAQQPSSQTTNIQSPFLSIPAVSDALQFGTQVPAFETKDISGRIWRSEDLRGKFTLVYIWHTFWARAADAHPRTNPNVLDLPELQRFYDRVRNAKNIQVLAFCKDYDYTHAPDYMKQAKYTFPVIADWVLINKLFPDAVGNPPYWLVNPEGRLSHPIRARSFGGLLYEVERVAASN